MMNRRSFLGRSLSLGASAAALAAIGRPALAKQLDADAVLNDPAAPTAGNPKGDLTIVAFLDYNCPFCKKATPVLDRLVAEDGGIRLVYKDWPILAKTSAYGARMALAAKYQGRYDAVHAALMGIPGFKIPEERMQAAIRQSGVDMPRLESDLKAHDGEISALLARNDEQAQALGLKGTPAFLVGRFIVPAALDYDSFKKVVAEARQQASAK